MQTPKELRYAKTHEWVRVEGNIAVVGITDHAQEELGDIVFVEQPPAGETFSKGDEIATVESVKASSPIYAPVSGTVESVNEELADQPELINRKPYEAFLFTLRITDASELDSLLDAEGYERAVREEQH